MTKWEYISLISKQGTTYGYDGGVLDLLEWCGKPNTTDVTLEEAKELWERCNAVLAEKNADSQREE